MRYDGKMIRTLLLRARTAVDWVDGLTAACITCNRRYAPFEFSTQERHQNKACATDKDSDGEDGMLSCRDAGEALREGKAGQERRCQEREGEEWRGEERRGQEREGEERGGEGRRRRGEERAGEGSDDESNNINNNVPLNGNNNNNIHNDKNMHAPSKWQSRVPCSCRLKKASRRASPTGRCVRLCQLVLLLVVSLIFTFASSVPLAEPSWLLGFGYSLPLWWSGHACDSFAKDILVLFTRVDVPPERRATAEPKDFSLPSAFPDVDWSAYNAIAFDPFDMLLKVSAKVKVATKVLEDTQYCGCPNVLEVSDLTPEGETGALFGNMEALLHNAILLIAWPCVHKIECPGLVTDVLLQTLASPPYLVAVDAITSVIASYTSGVHSLLPRLHFADKAALASRFRASDCITWESVVRMDLTGTPPHSFFATSKLLVDVPVQGQVCHVAHVRYGGRSGNALIENYVASIIGSSTSGIPIGVGAPSNLDAAVMFLDVSQAIIPEEHIDGFGRHSASLVLPGCPTNVRSSSATALRSVGTGVQIPARWFHADNAVFLNDHYTTGSELTKHMEVFRPDIAGRYDWYWRHYRINLERVSTGRSRMMKWFWERSDMLEAALQVKPDAVPVCADFVDAETCFLHELSALHHPYLPQGISQHYTRILRREFDAVMKASAGAHAAGARRVRNRWRKVGFKEDAVQTAQEQRFDMCARMARTAGVGDAFRNLAAFQGSDAHVEASASSQLRLLNEIPAAFLDLVQLEGLNSTSSGVYASLLDCVLVLHVRLGDVAWDAWRRDILRQAHGLPSVAALYNAGTWETSPDRFNWALAAPIVESSVIPNWAARSADDAFQYNHSTRRPDWHIPAAQGPRDPDAQAQYLIDLLELHCAVDLHHSTPLSVLSELLTGVSVRDFKRATNVTSQPLGRYFSRERPWLHVHIVTEPVGATHPMLVALTALTGASVQAADASHDFATLMAATNVMLSPSTFSWMAAVHGRATFVHYPHQAFLSLFPSKAPCLVVQEGLQRRVKQYWLYHDVLRVQLLNNAILKYDGARQGEDFITSITSMFPCESRASIKSRVERLQLAQGPVSDADTAITWYNQDYKSLQTFYRRPECYRSIYDTALHTEGITSESKSFAEHAKLSRLHTNPSFNELSDTVLCVDSFMDWTSSR